MTNLPTELPLRMGDKPFTVPTNRLTEAMTRFRLSAACWSVMFCLLRHTNRDTGKCFPSTGRMSKECGLARSTVSVAIAELEKYNLLMHIPGGFDGEKNLANQYFINDPNYHGPLFDGPPTLTQATRVTGVPVPEAVR